MQLSVRPLSPEDYDAWDHFVLQHPHGSPFHSIAWKQSTEKTFGYRPHYLLAQSGGDFEAVLPVFFVRNLLMGKALISTPFAVYGGILSRSTEARQALVAEVRRLGESLGVNFIELRNSFPEQCSGLPNVTRYVTFTQQIGPDAEAILESIPRKTRYMVRKAVKHPYTVQQTRDPKRFEAIYSQNLRRLGTPSFSPRHFSNLLSAFGDKADIREVFLNGTVVASVFSFYFRDQVLPYYGAADPAFNEFAPSNFMYYDLMRWAGSSGYKVFDFGRSKKESGSFDFKAHWGMETRDLPYEIILVRQRELPNFTPNNPRYHRAIELWQRIPLPITRALGPFLIKLVP
jgi:FemAB-related protein (PEP-CTERM system-associated)